MFWKKKVDFSIKMPYPGEEASIENSKVGQATSIARADHKPQFENVQPRNGGWPLSSFMEWNSRFRTKRSACWPNAFWESSPRAMITRRGNQ